MPDRSTPERTPDPPRYGAWRLRKHAEYQRVYKASRKQQSSLMTFFASPQQHAHAATWPNARVGLTAGRVLGNAVERNRIKRRMREAVRANLHLLPAQVDVILHPRRQVLTAEFSSLQLEVEKIFRIVSKRVAVIASPINASEDAAQMPR